MSTPKPHITPKGAPNLQEAQPQQHDTPPPEERDPPVFPERDRDPKREADDKVLFHEDDSLR